MKKKSSKDLGVPRSKAAGRSTAPTPSPKKAQGVPPTPSREYTLKLDLSQDEYYPDNYAIFLQTHEHSATRIAGEKQSGAWRTIRRWTVRITDNDLSEASAFALGIEAKPTKEAVRPRTGAKRSGAKPGASRATPKPTKKTTPTLKRKS